MKKSYCPCCGKEPIELGRAIIPRFCCDDCNLDITLSPDVECLVSIEDQELGLRVEWSNIGEGICGDYDPADPEDVNLLRFDVYWAPDADNDPDKPIEWEEVEDASYCTQVPADTPVTELIRLLYIIFKRYADVIGDYPYASVKKLGEELSWIAPKQPEDPKVKTVILREVSDPQVVYGVLIAETEEPMSEVVTKFLSAKADVAKTNDEWQVDDLVALLPKEWNARVYEEVNVFI